MFFLVRNEFCLFFLKKTKKERHFSPSLTFRASVLPCIDFQNQKTLFTTFIPVGNRPRSLLQTFNSEPTSTSLCGLGVSIATFHPGGPGSIPQGQKSE